MNAVTRDQLAELAADQGDVRVSIYMPTRPFSPGSQEEDTTRLKNHLRTAEELLAGRGLRQSEIDALLRPARAILEDRPFWLRSRSGLVLLIGPDGVKPFRTIDSVADHVFVGSRYCIRPLLPALGSSGTYWLLALSQKRVRLFSGSTEGLAEVPVEGMPDSLAEAMRWDDFEKASIQFHMATPGQGGARPSVVVHGSGQTDPKDELLRYFRGIDRGLSEHLKDDETPLIIAGVDYLLPLYREVNTYPHLAERTVSGSPGSFTRTALHEQSLAAAKQMWEADLARLAARVEELWASPRTRSDPSSVLAAAFENRIDTLLVSLDANWWGSFDPTLGRATVHDVKAENDEDLLDVAVAKALRGGADVVALIPSSMPHEAKAAALLRY